MVERGQERHVLEDLEVTLPGASAAQFEGAQGAGEKGETGSKKVFRRLKRKEKKKKKDEKEKEKENVGVLADGTQVGDDKLEEEKREEEGTPPITTAQVEEVGAATGEGEEKGEDLVEEYAAWEDPNDDTEEEEELVEFLKLENAGQETSRNSLSRSEVSSEDKEEEDNSENIQGQEEESEGLNVDFDEDGFPLDTENDADKQRELIAGAERERIGKGFNPDIKPMSSILDKINTRVQEAALRKPTELVDEAPGLKFSDFADRIMSSGNAKVEAINVEPAPEEAEEKEEVEGLEEEREEAEEELEEEEIAADDLEKEIEEKVVKRHEIRLAGKEETLVEDEVEEKEEECLESESESSMESESEEEEEEEEEEEQDNGFTWEEDEPLPEGHEEEEGRKEKKAKMKLPKVNRGFVEVEAEMSDDEGHLHDDEGKEDEDDDGADLEDLIDKRRYRESEGEGKRRSKFHQNWMNDQEEEDIQKVIEAVETGFRKKRKGLLGEDDENTHRDARRRRAELANTAEDFEDMERIFQAKMMKLKEEEHSDGEVEMVEAAYKRRKQRLAEKAANKENEKASFEKLISEEAIASIISKEDIQKSTKATLSRTLSIPKGTKRVEAAQEVKSTFVFGQKKRNSNSKDKKSGNPNISKGTLARTNSSLVKLLQTKTAMKSTPTFGTQLLSKLLGKSRH